MPYGIEDRLGHFDILRHFWRKCKRGMKSESLNLPYVALPSSCVQRVVEMSIWRVGCCRGVRWGSFYNLLKFYQTQ